MVTALCADILLGHKVQGELLKHSILVISLLVGYDVICREAFRYSLIHSIKQLKNSKNLDFSELTFIYSVIPHLIVMATAFAVLFTFAIDNVSYNESFSALTASLSLSLSSIILFFLNLRDITAFHGIRNFVIPTGIISWVLGGKYIDAPLTSYLAISTTVFCLVLIVTLTRLLSVEPATTIKTAEKFNLKFLTPALFPTLGYGTLQTSRFLERNYLPLVSSAAYSIYLLSKVYAAIVTLSSLVGSLTIARETTLQNSSNKNTRPEKSTIISTVVIWAALSLLIIIITAMAPFIGNSDVIQLTITYRLEIYLYLFAALVGSVNVLMQGPLYSAGLHKTLLLINVALNAAFIAFITAQHYATSNGLTAREVSIAFLSYVCSELAAYLLISNRKIRVA